MDCKKRLCIALPLELYNYVKQAAHQTQRTPSGFVRFLIWEQFRAEQNEQQSRWRDCCSCFQRANMSLNLRQRAFHVSKQVL